MREFHVRKVNGSLSESAGIGVEFPNGLTIYQPESASIMGVQLFFTFADFCTSLQNSAETYAIAEKPVFPLVAAPTTPAAALELLGQMSQDAQTLRIQQSQLLAESNWDQDRYGNIADIAWQHYNTADRALHNFLQQMLHK